MSYWNTYAGYELEPHGFRHRLTRPEADMGRVQKYIGRRVEVPTRSNGVDLQNRRYVHTGTHIAYLEERVSRTAGCLNLGSASVYIQVAARPETT
ncbi:hypothetical protein GOBAR_AA14748 [Gossypium barbadense]|uniref:Uncharacterized protein n=1 Tax=Gossypium barbadense TaxID=3634 RepID=A0A2P5XRB9_GOSBA|nr:hypothetical protein GOBAR_AA14748 [Gossypium barbadense]